MSEKQDDSTDTPEPSDDLATLRAELTEARAEAARYRVARNTALKRSYALASIAKAHNLGIDPDELDLDGLRIEHGKAVGEFAYTVPGSNGQAPPPPSGESGTTLSLDDVKAWSPKEINERWDEVKPLLEASKE
ncbi:MAG: hypothetical protein F4Y92_01965 [Dehalococcoidia bacterium]|nr:hypothetical protein [Dehalococcoidia bacterium]